MVKPPNKYASESDQATSMETFVQIRIFDVIYNNKLCSLIYMRDISSIVTEAPLIQTERKRPQSSISASTSRLFETSKPAFQPDNLVSAIGEPSAKAAGKAVFQINNLVSETVEAFKDGNPDRAQTVKVFFMGKVSDNVLGYE